MSSVECIRKKINKGENVNSFIEKAKGDVDKDDEEKEDCSSSDDNSSSSSLSSSDGSSDDNDKQKKKERQPKRTRPKFNRKSQVNPMKRC